MHGSDETTHPRRFTMAEAVREKSVATESDSERLLRAVTTIADILVSQAAESDARGRLTAKTVEALRINGFWRMRLCRELGGLELPITTQVQVLAALAAKDTASAWCTMVANNAVAVLGATMPAQAIEQIFADGVPACSIAAAPAGKATPVAGGYRITGTWRLASSIHHADWVHAVTFVEGDPSRPLSMAVPARDVDMLDSWRAIGLAGTGSNDFTLTDYLLPAVLTGSARNPYSQLRGAIRYDFVGVDHLESYEHLAFAIGVARRALAELRSTFARQSERAHTGDREVVQIQLGRAVITLRALEAAAVEIYTKVDTVVTGNEHVWTEADRHLPRALAAWATEHALELVQLAFHRSGAAAVQRPNILEKLLRDMNVAATHLMVDDTAFSTYAHHLIESSGAGGLRDAG